MPIIFPSSIVINLKIFRAQYKQTILHDYSALYIHLDYNVEQFGKIIYINLVVLNFLLLLEIQLIDPTMTVS